MITRFDQKVKIHCVLLSHELLSTKIYYTSIYIFYILFTYAPIITPQATVIDMGPITHVIPDDPEPKTLDPQDELLRWHYHLGHLPFDRVKQLADKGQLLKRLLTCPTPFCAACQYGKMTKRPWRVKGENKGAAKTATHPGQIVSVDQLESTTPGFIAQLKGTLTQQRYKFATVFVDQFSR